MEGAMCFREKGEIFWNAHYNKLCQDNAYVLVQDFEYDEDDLSGDFVADCVDFYTYYLSSG